MTQRDWIEKDFYRELGVASGATAGRDQEGVPEARPRAAPGRQPRRRQGRGPVQVGVGGLRGALGREEAQGVRRDPRAVRGRRRSASAAARLPRRLRHRRTGGQTLRPERPAPQRRGQAARRAARAGSATSSAACSAAAAVAGAQARPRPAAQPARAPTSSPSSRIDFVDAVRGAEVPIRLSSPGRCETCGGTGAGPGTAPHACPTCDGRRAGQPQPGRVRVLRAVPRLPRHRPDHRRPVPGVRRRRREHPHPLAHRPRSRPGWPTGSRCGSRARASRAGAGRPAGDLYVNVHVTPHRLFGRSEQQRRRPHADRAGDVPGAGAGRTLTVPTLDGRTVSLRIPAGTRSGRTFRVRGRGVARKKATTGDLLVTVEVAVPATPRRRRARAPCSPTPRPRRAFDPRAELLRAAR